MQADELSHAIQRAIQFTIGQKITSELKVFIVSPQERVAITVGTAILTLLGKFIGIVCADTITDLSLIVATSTLMQSLIMTSPNSVYVNLIHLSVVLEGSSIIDMFSFLGLNRSFLGQVQYTFAQLSSGLLLSAHNSVFALSIAGGLTLASMWKSEKNDSLSTALVQTAFNILKVMILQSIPVALKLPTIVGILAFIKPVYVFFGPIGESLYSFALYQCGDALQDALESKTTPFVAGAVAITSSFFFPIQAVQAALRIAAIGSLTDWFMLLIKEISDNDPIPSLIGILVFCHVLSRLSQ